MEECFVCFYETDKFIIFECGHKTCNLCYPQLISPLCPVCNTKIKVYHKNCCNKLLFFLGIYSYII